MLKIEIDLWPILYGVIFFIIYLTFINLNKINKIHKTNKKNNFNNDIENINIMNIECTCQTFFIDENELKDCKHCINKYLTFLEDTKKKKKKCMSFPA